MKSLSCVNLECPLHRKLESGSIIRHGFYRTKSGKRHRYRCLSCGKTFCSTRGTPYYRLQHRRTTFDEVAALRVEGVSISAIARVKGITWNTVARWLERASAAAERFNRRMLRDFEIVELQADELFTFIGSKSSPMWLFATIEVSSRLWAGSLVGRRQGVTKDHPQQERIADPEESGGSAGIVRHRTI